MPEIITSLKEFEEFCRKQKSQGVGGISNPPIQPMNRFEEFQQKSAKVPMSPFEEFLKKSQKGK